MVTTPHTCTLILGGARSGKSRHAEGMCRETGLSRLYIATAAAQDAEMEERIATHQSMRAKDGWQTIEEQHLLPDVLASALAPDSIALVDCLTLWLTNRLLVDANLEAETDQLCTALEARSGPVVFVSNETGLGIVPDNALARRFRDAQGILNQRVAAVSTHVHFVAAGLPLVLKEPNS